ncbi:MAG: hypothetical protein KDA93_01265 [Planctomycetaceae bacterium]|nr:hypothetical protein [Planctomycetaceae bacterium]
MTGYTVHTGASEKFVEGWDKVFGDQKKKPGKKTAGSQKPKAKAPAKSKKRK